MDCPSSTTTASLMATEDAKPESTLIMERESEGKDHSDASCLQVDNFPSEEKTHEESFLEKAQGNVEYLMNDINDGNESGGNKENPKEESMELQNQASEFKGDSQVTSFVDKDEHLKDFDAPAVTKSDPEIVHSSVVLDQTKTKTTDFAEMVSMKGDGISPDPAVPEKHNETEEGKSGHSEKERLSIPLVAESKNETSLKYMESDSLEDNSGTLTKDSQSSTKSTPEMKETSCTNEVPSMDNIESDKQSSSGENHESFREASNTGCVDIKQNPTMAENQNKAWEEGEANSIKSEFEKAEEGPEFRSNQSTVEPEDNHTESFLVQKEPAVIKATDYSHVSLPLEPASTGEETPSLISNQEQGPVKCVEEDLNDATTYAHGTTVEDTIQEARETPLEEILEAGRSDDQNNVKEEVEEDKPNHNLKNSIDETCMDFGMVYSQNNREECIDQETEDNSLPSEEVNRDMSLSNFRVEAIGDGSLQEFQSVAHTNEATEEANHSELLDVKDCCIVTSDETSKAVVPQTVKDVREQKEVPTPTAPEEIKEELAYTNNAVPQASEDYSFDQEAIEKAYDSIDRDTSQGRPGKEEASADKATTDGMPLDTSNISPHEEPQKTIESEETDLEQSIPGLASKDQTTKQEQGDKVSIIEIAENGAVEEANSVAENEIQDHSKVVLIDSVVQTVEYHDVDRPPEDSSKGVFSFDPDCRSTEAVLVTNAAQVSSAVASVDYLEEMPSMKLPTQEPTLTRTGGKMDSTNTNTDGNIVYKATDASFETSIKQELIHNEGNEPAELDIRCTLTKEIDGECHGTESEPKEYFSAADDPLEGKSEKIQEPSIEEKTEDAEIADGEHLTLYQSLGSRSKMTDEQYEQATEPLSTEDKNCKSQQDIPSSQEFGEKPETYTENHTTEENDQVKDKSSAEDSRCGVPEQEVSLQTYQKDELTQEADSSETATRLSEETELYSNTTKMEEHETVDVTQTFQDQMASDQKVVEGSSNVLIEEEVADYSHLGEKKDKGLHQEIDQEVDPLIQMLSEVRVVEGLGVPSEISTEKETRSYSTAEENEEVKQEAEPDDESINAGDSKEFEEPEIAHTTQSFLEQLSNKENDIEKAPQVSIAVHNSLAEEEEEENANETKNKDGIKLEEESRSTVQYVPETGNCTSYSSKIQSEDEIFKGDIQIAQEISKDGHVEAEEDESNHRDMIYMDQLKPEISHEVQAEELETTEGKQRLNTEMEFQDKDVDTPPLVSLAEDAVKCNSVEEENIPDDILVPRVDPEPKVDDTSELEDTEEVNEEPSQVSTAQKTIDCTPAEGVVDDHVRNSTKEVDLKSEEYPGVKENEMPETINSESQIVKMTDAKEMTNEREFIIAEEPHAVSTSEEIEFYTFQEKEEKIAHDLMATDELNAKADPEVRANETSEPSPMGASEITKPVETDMTDASQGFKNQIPNKDQVDEEPSPGLTAEETVNQTPEEEQKEKGCITNSTKEGDLNSEIDTGVTKDEIHETINSESQSTEIADVKLSLNIQMTTEDKGIIIECPQQFSTSEEIVYHGIPREENRNTNDTPAKDDLYEKEDPETRINEAPRTTHCASESTKIEDTTQSCKELEQGEDVVGAGHNQPSHREAIMDSNLSAERKKEWNVNATVVPAKVKPDVMVSEIFKPVINLSESAKLEELETSEPNWTINKQIASEGSIVEVTPPSTSIDIINETLAVKGNDESIDQVTRSKVESKIEGNPSIEGNEASDTPRAESATTKLEETDTIVATQKCENQISREDQINEEPCQVLTAEKTKNQTSAEEVEVEGYVSNSTKKDDLISETYTGEPKDAKKSDTACTESQSAKMTDANQSVKTQVTSEETIEEPRQVSTSEEQGDYSPPEEEDRNINDTTAMDELNQKVLEPETIDDSEGSKRDMQGGENMAGEVSQLSNMEEIVNHAVESKEEWTVKEATVLDNELQPESMVNEVSAVTNNFNENIKLEEGKATESIWSSNIQMAREEKIVEVPFQDSTSNEISSHDLSDKELEERACKNSTIDELKIEGNLNVQQMDDTAETPSMESEATKSVGENEMPGEDSGLESPCNSPTAEEVIIYNTEDDFKEESIVKVAEINAKSKSEEMMNYNSVVERKEETNISNTSTEELNFKLKVNEISKAENDLNENTKPVETDMTDASQSFENQTPNKDQVDEEPSPGLTAEDTVNQTPEEEQKAEGFITNSTKEGDLNSEIDTGVTKDEIHATVNSESQSTEVSRSIAVVKLSLNIQMTTEDQGIIIECPPQFSTSEEIVYHSISREENGNINDTPAKDKLYEKEDPETRVNEAPRTTHCASESTKFEESPIIDTTQSCKELEQGEDMMVSEISEPIINLSESTKLEELETSEPNWTVNEQIASEGSIVEVPPPSTSIEIENESLAVKGNDESIAQVTRRKVESKIEGNPSIEGNEASDTPRAESATKLEEMDTIVATQKCENQISREDQINEEPCQVLTAEKTKNQTSAEEVEVEGYVSNSTKEDDLISETYTGEPKDAKKSETGCTESQSAMITQMTDANQSIKTQVTSEETIEEPRQVSTSEELGDYSPPEEEERNINDTTAMDELNQQVLEPETIDDSEGSKRDMQGGENMAEEISQLSNMEEIVNHAVESKEEWTVKEATVLDNELQPESMVNEVSAVTNNFNENIKFKEGKATESIWSSNIQMAREEKIVEVPFQDSTSNEISSHDLSDKELDERACKNSTIDELKIEGNLNVQQMGDTAETPSMESEATKSVGENEMPGKDSGLESPCNSPTVEEVIIYNTEDDSKEETIVKLAEINAKSKSEDTELNSQDMPQTITNTSENTKSDGTEIIYTTQTFKKKCPSDDRTPGEPNPVSGEQEVANSNPALEEKEEVNIKFGTTTLEQADEFASTRTEIIAKTSNTKNSSSEVESEPSFINTEGPSPDSEDREAVNKDYDSKMEIEEKDDSVLLTDANISMDIHMPYESSIAESNLEIIANQSPKTDTITKIESQGEDVAKKQKDSADETLQVEREELEHEDTSKDVSNTVSTIPRESSLNSDEKEQIVKEPVKLLPPTSMTMLHDDEKEDTMIHYQSQCHSSHIMEKHPATEIQNEPYLSHKIPDDAMFPDSEGRGAPNQIDSSNTKIEQKDDLVALKATPAVHAPFKSSIPVSDMDNMATKYPKTGVDAKIASKEEGMTIIHPTDETLQPEVEGLDPEGEVVTEAVSIIMQDSSSKDDKIEEKFQEQGNMSKQTQVTKLNEEVKDLDRDEYQSVLAIEHDSAREAQSEPLLQEKKPTEGILLDSREEIEQNNSLIDVAESRANHLQFKISNAGTDMETTENEDPKTGIDKKIESQDKEMSIPEKNQAGKTVQTDMKKLESESTSNAVAQAVSSSPQESSLKDDEEGAKEQVKHSDQENVLNEGKEEYKIDHSSASKVQNEQSLNNRPTDEMLTEGKVLVHAGELFPEIQHGEIKEETAKSASEEESMTSLHNLLQTSMYGNAKVTGDSKIENEPTVTGNDAKEDDKPNSGEDKDEEDTEREAASDSPVIVEASRDADVKITPKKSNNILSAVGSKVKHSIAKVKKVITGKSSSPKPSSHT